jgi:hypothetical protein
MRHLPTAALLLLTTLGLACASSSVPKVVVNEKVPAGATIGVVSFRDCVIPTQVDDCPGSGNVAGPMYARVLASKPTFKVIPLSRPVAANQELTDAAALEVGRQNNVQYVLNGEVNDYYSVAPMTYRSDRAAVTVRLIRVSDGTVVAFQTETVQGANFKTPADLIQKVAERFRDAI